jgi:hypothetical protein
MSKLTMTSLRIKLILNGSIKPNGVLPKRPVVESQQIAIASRRKELSIKPVVTWSK